MKFYHRIFLSPAIKADQNAIIESITKQTWQANTYLITLAGSEQNHLEIFHTVLLCQKQIPTQDLFVVGIANGIEEAKELVEKITQEVYDKTKGVDIKNYILRTQQEYEKGNV